MQKKTHAEVEIVGLEIKYADIRQEGLQRELRIIIECAGECAGESPVNTHNVAFHQPRQGFRPKGYTPGGDPYPLIGKPLDLSYMLGFVTSQDSRKPGRDAVHEPKNMMWIPKIRVS